MRTRRVPVTEKALIQQINRGLKKDHQDWIGQQERQMASVADDTLFVRRLIVNYLRSELTPYDETLYSAFRK